MINGLYISAMGLQVQEYRQAVTANNLANAQTAGFKRAIANVQARANAAQEDPAMRRLGVASLQQLNGGVWAQPTSLDLRQGTLDTTRNPLDLALDGPGFFAVQAADGSKLLTRDGKFTLNVEGDLITANDGKKVLDADGTPIRLNPALQIEVNGAGEVRQDGSTVAILGVVNVENPQAIEPAGSNAMRLRDGASAKQIAGGTQVRQGCLEQSGVDAVNEMVSMIECQRAFEANARLISMQDQMLQQINSIGRIA